MKTIIIGAGRGIRIVPYSQNFPKCFTEVNGKRILDYILNTLKKSNLTDIHFIGGYLIDVVKKEYPLFTFHYNAEWETNNILASLFFAENAMKNGFISTYSDIIYTPKIVQKLLESPYDITIAVDTNWKKRYKNRLQHPMDDAEKVLYENNRIKMISRRISNENANGEFIGVAKFSAKGAQKFIDHYYKAKQKYDGKPFHEAPIFKKAYMIQLFQEMLKNGEDIYCVKTNGSYYEIDTVEDLKLVSEALPR